METQATPRPWKLIDDGDGDIEITDLEQQFGACRVREDSNENRTMMKANAELIVRAVNRDHLFDELVKFVGDSKCWCISALNNDCKACDLLKRAKGES